MRLFTILDRYIIKKFLSTFFIAIFLMIAVILIFDLSDKMGKFIDNKIPTKAIITEYYFSLIPYFLNIFMSLFVFISILFFTSKMAGKSEIIAILSSGVSFKRLFFPYFVVALLLASMSFVLGNFIIPQANKKRIEFENQFIYYRPNKDARDIHKQISPGVYVYIKFYDVNNDIGHIFTIERFEGSTLVSKFYSDNIFWDNEKKLWRANNYWIRDFKLQQDNFKTGSSIDTNIYLMPKDIKETLVNMETMNMLELDKFIEEQRLHGNQSLNYFLLEKHKRISLPFSMFILSFIALAMSSKKIRGGTGINMGIGIVLSFAYILFSKVSDQYAIRGNMTPFLSCWTPNFIFAFISVFIYRVAPK